MTTAPDVIRGTVYVLTDNIDTDQIIPAEFLNLVPTIPAEYAALGSHAMGGMPDGATPFIPHEQTTTPYSIIVAGRNFGCGSSREHAPIALGAAGVNAFSSATRLPPAKYSRWNRPRDSARRSTRATASRST